MSMAPTACRAICPASVNTTEGRGGNPHLDAAIRKAGASVRIALDAVWKALTDVRDVTIEMSPQRRTWKTSGSKVRWRADVRLAAHEPDETIATRIDRARAPVADAALQTRVTTVA